jgi:thiamine biosynthesis protein ThiS
VSAPGESKSESVPTGHIEITVNGEQKQVPSGLNILKLLEQLAIRSDRVAIERNLNILPKDRWQETLVASGDRYEIVHFVGGG